MEYSIMFRLVSVLIVPFEAVKGSGTITVKLDRYTNPDSIVADGKGTCCDGLVFCSSSPCDPFFRLCYTHIGAKRNCDILKKETSHFDNKKDITFGEMIGNVRNPTTSTFTSSHKVQVGVSTQITVVDYDNGVDDIIEVLKFDYRFERFHMVTPSKYKIVGWLKGRACRIHITNFVECDRGWYGQHCDKTCQEFQMTSYPGMYGCNHNGYLVACKDEKTNCQHEMTTAVRPRTPLIDVIRATSPSTTTLHAILTTSAPQRITSLYTHVTHSQRPYTERSTSDVSKFSPSTEVHRHFNSNNINLNTSSNVSTGIDTSNTIGTSPNDSQSVPTDDIDAKSTTGTSWNNSPSVPAEDIDTATDDLAEKISHVSNLTVPPCISIGNLQHIRNSLLLTFRIADNVSLSHKKRNVTLALESWKRLSNVNNFTIIIANISGSSFSLAVTVPSEINVSTLMETVFEEGNLEEWIEKAIGHSIIPVNRPLCSTSMIKQVKISQRAGDHSSAIIGIVMGALFLVATTAAVGLSYQWHLMFRKRTRKVCPENSSVEFHMVEEETRD